MASRRLTQRLIETLKPGKSVREVRDTELRGFGVRILPSGRKSYIRAFTDRRAARLDENRRCRRDAPGRCA